jgi:hypothetical protein
VRQCAGEKQTKTTADGRQPGGPRGHSTRNKPNQRNKTPARQKAGAQEITINPPALKSGLFYA